MNTLETIINTRRFILGLVSNLTTEQLNEIPAGFNNNIVWNLAHLVAAQQGLCYIRSGATPAVSADFISSYKSGSKPEKNVSAEEIAIIKEMMFDTIHQLEKDLQANVFSNYEAFKTRYEVEIKDINDAVQFILFHEGLHCGYIMALRKLVAK